LNYAISLIKEKKWKDAIEQTDKVLEIEPKNIKALYRKALVFIGMDNWDDAMKLLVEAKELDPTNTAIQQEIQKLKKQNSSTSQKRSPSLQKSLSKNRSTRARREKRKRTKNGS